MNFIKEMIIAISLECTFQEWRKLMYMEDTLVSRKLYAKLIEMAVPEPYGQYIFGTSTPSQFSYTFGSGQGDTLLSEYLNKFEPYVPEPEVIMDNSSGTDNLILQERPGLN